MAVFYLVALGKFDKMKILKALGGVANGWLKFFVTLAAVGWFGFNALDRYTGSESESSIPTEDLTVAEGEVFAVTPTSPDSSTPTEDLTVAEPGSIDVEPQMTYASTVGNMNFAQMKDEVTGFAKNPNATVLLGLLSAFGLGLASRPGIDWFNKKRRIRSAKKRAKRYEEDRQLLAEATRKQEAQAVA